MVGPSASRWRAASFLTLKQSNKVMNTSSKVKLIEACEGIKRRKTENPKAELSATEIADAVKSLADVQNPDDSQIEFAANLWWATRGYVRRQDAIGRVTFFVKSLAGKAGSALTEAAKGE